MTSLLTVLLLDDIGRHLTRAETRHFYGLAHALQALINILVQIGDSHQKVQTTLKGVCCLLGDICGVRFH